jgi:hypothetical protein
MTFFLKVILFCGWISVAAVPKIVDGRLLISPVLSPARDAYLFFGIVGFFISIFFFVVNLFNIVNLRQFEKLPWNLIMMLTDFLWTLPMFVLGMLKQNMKI